MIEAVREWITSIVMVTMFLSVAQTVIPTGNIRKVFSFVGGLVLMVALLQPILEIDLDHMEFHREHYEDRVRECREELEETAGAEWEMIIEREIAAYISDKADSLGVEILVQVRAETETDGALALSAELTGPMSESLAEYLEQELGIPRERQVWIHEGKN